MEIRIEDMVFSYSSTPVLDDICLDIKEAQFVSILGPNGVGKSTLIHCINKILDPTSGMVFLDGKNVKEYSLKEMAQKVGYVPYVSSDTFPLSVVDTILLSRHPHAGWKTSDEDLEIVYDTMTKLGIEDLAMRPFNELSAGQHQRVMIARGLAQMPELLMLDEPTSNLDIYHQLYTMKLLHDLAHERNMTVLVICHDLNVAAKFSDRVIMFCKGRVHSDGPVEEILTAKTIRDVYGVTSDIIEVDDHPYVIYHSDDIDTGVAPAQRITSIPRDEKERPEEEDTSD